MPYVSLPELISAVCAGEAVISFPTDTVPALAVRPDCSALIYKLKHRSAEKPLILLGADADDLWPYITGNPAELNLWRQAIDDVWPGPLTLVLPASDQVPPEIHPQTPHTIGIRVPGHSLARYILGFTGPLATTSANLSGQPPLMTREEIAAQFPDVWLLTHADLEKATVDVALMADQSSLCDRNIFNHSDANTAENMENNYGGKIGVPSTVAKWSQQGWEILRQGAVRL